MTPNIIFLTGQANTYVRYFRCKPVSNIWVTLSPMTPLAQEFVDSCPVENDFPMRGLEMTRDEVFADAAFAASENPPGDGNGKRS